MYVSIKATVGSVAAEGVVRGGKQHELWEGGLTSAGSESGGSSSSSLRFPPINS